jgi:thiamine biosynthesis lipoprotein
MALALGLFLVLTAGCEPRRPRIVKRTQFVMGTLVEISVIGQDNESTADAMTQAFHEMQGIEKRMSRTIEESEVCRVNEAAGKHPVEVSRDLLLVARLARETSHLSEGAFDITVGSLVNLWTRCWKEDRVPTQEEVLGALRWVDYKDLVIDEARSRLFLTGMGMELTLGGIAKGYAVDRAFHVLHDFGVEDLIVNAGGDLRTGGTKFGAPWIVGIRDPRDGSRIMTKMSVTNAAVATSGDYERFFIKNGVRYHHILDPRTGFPARRCRSVTVVCDELVWADALATAVFVLGPVQGLDLVEKRPDTEALIVDGKGQVFVSSGMEKRITLE